MNDLQFSWNNFLQSSQEAQEQILEGMGFNNLDSLPWRKQADLFDGAPFDVILCYFKDLHWEAQAKVWKNYLPANAEKWVKAHLKPEAARKLGLRKKSKTRKHCLA